jgi:sulfur transfer complex TusBCD TusB component (DsrH family)
VRKSKLFAIREDMNIIKKLKSLIIFVFCTPDLSIRRVEKRDNFYICKKSISANVAENSNMKKLEKKRIMSILL